MSSNPQQALFLDPTTATVYEQPLNERIRGFLRLEHLFQDVATAMARDTVTDARQAVAGLIDIVDQLGRADIKGDLLKEMERHLGTLFSLRENPGVNKRKLEQTLNRLAPLVALLKSGASQPGSRMRQSELITQVRQRLAIPGGLCSFDLPAFHHWLTRGHRRRLAQLNEWMEDMRIIEDGIKLTLRLIRDAASPQPAEAIAGFYQQSLDPNAGCQLVRVLVPAEHEIFAEISGGKHRFSVRFLRQESINVRPQQVSDDVPFELQCCAL